jgi:hypothetical protein
MSLLPFERLSYRREIGRADLPDDLARFYREYEGVGFESSPDDFPVRLGRLRELEHHTWRQVHIFGQDEEPGWNAFEGIFLGWSSFLDAIYYVLVCPCCSNGAILTIGAGVAGPGGKGSSPFEPSLVLAPTFELWIERLVRFRGVEFGLYPGEIASLPRKQRIEQKAYFRALNPGSDLAPERPGFES